MEVVATPSTGAEVINIVRGENGGLGVAVVNTDMKDLDGFEISRILEGRIRVVLRFAGDPAMVAAKALRSGAHGVVSRTSEPSVVAAAIRGAHHGNFFLEPKVLRQLRDGEAPAPFPERHEPSGLGSLTDREQEVLILVGQGLDNRGIATQLTVSEGTVKTHVNRVMNKLCLPSRARIVVFCYENALITPAIQLSIPPLPKRGQLTR